MKLKSIIYFLSILLCSNSFYVLANNNVIATMTVGVTPAGLAVTPDGKFAYVANNNNYGLLGGNSVTVLNLTNNTFKKTIRDISFNEPYTISINPSGNKAYVTNSNSTTITIIDTQNNQVTGVIDGFDGPSGLAINSTGTVGYVNNYGGPEGAGSGNGKTVFVVNLTTNNIIKKITVDQAPAAIAISPDNKFVYVANYVNGNIRTGTMNIIRTSDNKVVGTITGFSGPFAIAITPDNKFAYVTNFGSNNFTPIGTTVSVVDLTNRVIIKNIQLGIQPSGIAITPNGRYVYATNYNTLYAGPGFTNLTAGRGTVNVIDTRTNEVIPPTIPVDSSPSAITISPDGRFAYVSNYTSNTVNVIFIAQPNNAFDQAIVNKYGCNGWLNAWFDDFLVIWNPSFQFTRTIFKKLRKSAYQSA